MPTVTFEYSWDESYPYQIWYATEDEPYEGTFGNLDEFVGEQFRRGFPVKIYKRGVLIAESDTDCTLNFDIKKDEYVLEARNG